MNLIIDSAGQPTYSCTLAAFLAANSDFDADEIAEVEALEVGASITYGGGAAPESVVERVS